MKNPNEQKTVFQGLIKLMKDSIDAFSARGRAVGKIKTGKDELAKLTSAVPDKTELCEMETIAGSALKMNAVRDDLKRNEAELVKLTDAATKMRKAFDDRLNAAIGDMKSEEGKSVAKSWGFFVQKSVVLGLTNANSFRYVDPRTAESLRLIADAYVQGHNVLGKVVEYGVNPRSVQELNAELVKALASAESGTDPDKVQNLRIAMTDLQKNCSHLLKMKVEKSGDLKRSTAVQSAQARLSTGRVAKSGSVVENSSVTMGQTAGKEPLPAPRKKGPAFTSPRKGGEQK